MPYTDNSRYASKQMWRMETFFYFVNLISTAYLTWSKDVSSQWVKYNVPGVINSGHDFINECCSDTKSMCACFTAPVVRLDRKSAEWWVMGLKGEHLCKGGKLGALQRAACDLSPQLWDFKSHVSVSKHTCWKACWEYSIFLSTHTGRYKLYLPTQIHLEELLAI